MCKFCSRYREQLLFLRQTARLYSESDEDSNLSVQLSSEVGKRIKESMVRFIEKHECVRWLMKIFGQDQAYGPQGMLKNNPKPMFDIM